MKPPAQRDDARVSWTGGLSWTALAIWAIAVLVTSFTFASLLGADNLWAVALFGVVIGVIGSLIRRWDRWRRRTARR